MPNRSAIPANDSPTNTSCSALSRSNVRQRRKQLVESRQVLPDYRFVLVFNSPAVQILGPFDEDGLRFVVEAEVGELGEVVRRGRAPGHEFEVRQRLEVREGAFPRRLVR